MSDSEEETRSFLINLPIFSSFNVDELSVFARHMSFIHLQRGEYLFVEGDHGNIYGFCGNRYSGDSKKSRHW